MVDGEVAGIAPEVEELAEGDVEEVSGAAGGVEDANGGELVEAGGEEEFGVGGGVEEGGLGARRQRVWRM